MRHQLIVLSCFLSVQAGAQVYSPVSLRGNVSAGAWQSISGLVAEVISGGSYTNGAVINYRLSGTNLSGRLPVSSNVVAQVAGTTNATAVQISWPRVGGLFSYVVERSMDGGSSWTNWLAVGPASTNWIDTGTNDWTIGVFTNLFEEIPEPSVPWPSDAFSPTGGVITGEVYIMPVGDIASLGLFASTAFTNGGWIRYATPNSSIYPNTLLIGNSTTYLSRVVIAPDVVIEGNLGLNGGFITNAVFGGILSDAVLDSIGDDGYIKSVPPATNWWGHYVLDADQENIPSTAGDDYVTVVVTNHSESFDCADPYALWSNHGFNAPVVGLYTVSGYGRLFGWSQADNVGHPRMHVFASNAIPSRVSVRAGIGEVGGSPSRIEVGGSFSTTIAVTNLPCLILLQASVGDDANQGDVESGAWIDVRYNGPLTGF